MREITESRNDSIMRQTELSAFIEEELEKRGWQQTILVEKSGLSYSAIDRIRDGQEAKPSQLARLAKGFGYKFWYVVQRAGYTPDVPGEPGAEARRLGVVFAGNAELMQFVEQIPRLSLANRRQVLLLIRTMLESQEETPKKPPKSRKKQ